MNWLDVVILCLIAAISIAELMRGFGRAIFDLLCLIPAALLAGFLSTWLSTTLPIIADPEIAHGYLFVALFCTFGWVALRLARFLYGATLLNMGMFENLFGLLAGFAVALIISHSLVSAISLTDRAGSGGAALVADGAISNEMLTFHNYHAIVDAAQNGGSVNRDLPDGN